MAKIKICGITNFEDALNASKFGADYLGFIFYKKSPRYITEQKAKQVIKKLPLKVKKVGVFVDEKINAIKKIVDFCELDIIQLSGSEYAIYIKKLKKICGKKIIKVFRIKNKKDIKSIKKYKADYIMLDTYKKGTYGGTGEKFDWSLIKNINKKKLFLSGGLNSSNVRLAIKEIKPYAVDVCSSIESSKVKKDFQKMKEFIDAVKII